MSSSEARRVLAGRYAELAGDSLLVVEQQAVLAPPGEVVQADAEMLQKVSSPFSWRASPRVMKPRRARSLQESPNRRRG
jgi:hypothetical protein